jgi:hypothetical protein
MITVYHGSDTAFDKPSLDFAQDKRDFGIGFYTTLIQDQARSWAKAIAIRSGKTPFLYTFELDLSGLRIKEFPEINMEWLETVSLNRKQGGVQHDFDVMTGPVADDRTMQTITLYLRGSIDAEYTMQRLRYFQPNNQVSLHTEQAMRQLTLIGREDG